MTTLPEQILDWSVKRPAWQRDALRRLLSCGALATSDVTELIETAKGLHAVIIVIQRDARTKLGERDMIHQLRKHSTATIHESTPKVYRTKVPRS